MQLFAASSMDSLKQTCLAVVALSVTTAAGMAPYPHHHLPPHFVYSMPVNSMRPSPMYMPNPGAHPGAPIMHTVLPYRPMPMPAPTTTVTYYRPAPPPPPHSVYGPTPPPPPPGPPAHYRRAQSSRHVIVQRRRKRPPPVVIMEEEDDSRERPIIIRRKHKKSHARRRPRAERLDSTEVSPTLVNILRQPGNTDPGPDPLGTRYKLAGTYHLDREGKLIGLVPGKETDVRESGDSSAEDSIDFE